MNLLIKMTKKATVSANSKQALITFKTIRNPARPRDIFHIRNPFIYEFPVARVLHIVGYCAKVRNNACFMTTVQMN